MDTQVIQPARRLPALELDLIADLACPWSYLGKRSLERALESLYGTPIRALRWHGFPLQSADQQPRLGPTAWEQHLLSRLPKGIDVKFAHRSLTETGRELGIAFDFSRVHHLPDTREAHRLVKLAGREGRQSEMVDALFGAFFEQGRDIGQPQVLEEVAADVGLTASARSAFRNPGEAADEIVAEEKRLRSLGVTAVPNLLINGRVLVPGPADVSTYVHALDQALFPELTEPADGVERRLH